MNDMVTLNAKVSVNGERKIELELPPSLPSGDYDVVIVLSEIPKTEKRKKTTSKAKVLEVLENFAQAPKNWTGDAQDYINQLRKNDRF